MKGTFIIAITVLVLVSSCTKDTSIQEKVTLDPNAKKVFSPENITPPTKETSENLVPLPKDVASQENVNTGVMDSKEVTETIIPPLVERSKTEVNSTNTGVVTVTQSGVVTENRVEEIPSAPLGALQMNGFPPSEGD